MAIEINETGIGKIYKFFCEKCGNFVERKEEDIIIKEKDNGIKEKYLKCDFCGHKIKI